jgi:RimJ/RimL family protein N-acetyltransferase
MIQKPRGSSISLATNRFLARSLTPADASERWCAWYADSEVAGPMHARVRHMTLDQLARHSASFDSDHRYLIGIFTKATSQHIGLFMVVVDKAHALATFNVMIGDKDYWGKGVVNEVRGALLDEFFESRGVEKACGRPFARNFPAVFNYKVQGWRLEGVMRGHSKSVVDGSRVDQYLFGILREEWRARKGQAA